MDDLIFKDIPADGFHTETGFTERVSNPTPSRKGIVAPNNGNSFPDSGQRFSNPTPSRRVNDMTESFQNTPQQIYPQEYSPDSRLSNPTPTRRRRGNHETAPSVPVSPVDDSRSRVSNPTPTRRQRQSQSQSSDLASFGVIPNAKVSRASNPTPRRRKTEFVPEETLLTNSEPQQQPFSQIPEMIGDTYKPKEDIPLISPLFNQQSGNNESLSFASVDNPYGIEDGEVTISTPVGVPFEADTPEKSTNDGRMSTPIATHRK